MPYLLKNNRIDGRYEEIFFQIIKENLHKERIDIFTGLLNIKTAAVNEFVSKILAGGNEPEKNEYENILSLIFPIRRHKNNILEYLSSGALREGFYILGDKKKSAEIRLGRFLGTLRYDNVIVKRDFAMEILHFLEPDRNILWASWVYRQDNGTGCLPYMADFLKRTWDGNPYIMPFSMKEMRDEINYLYELSYKNGLDIKPPYGADILLSYMYADYVYKMVYAESKSLSTGVPDGVTIMKKLLGVEKFEQKAA